MVVTYAIALNHTNIVPESEVITVAGGQYVSLVRDEDYTIDYTNGILNIIVVAVAAYITVPNSDLLLNVAYRYRVDFDEETVLESHIEVFGEVATVVDSFEIEVQNSPVSEIFRVFNRTTREEYDVETYLNNRITLLGNVSPAIENLVNQQTLLRDRVFTIDGFFEDTIGLVLPDYLEGTSNEHPLSSVNKIAAITLYRELIQGGVDVLQNTYDIEVTADIVDIAFFTGSTILRRATQQLISGTDYNVIFDADSLNLTVNFTSQGLETIGSNSVFYRNEKTFPPLSNSLYDEEGALQSEHRIVFKEKYISEVVTFNSGIASLTKFKPFIESGQEIDSLIYPSLVVTNQQGTISFTQGEDFIIDTSLQRLIRIETSTKLSASQTVKVSYVEEESFTSDVTIARDVVLVDYDYGTNSIDWTPGIEDTAYTEQRELTDGTRYFALTKFPADENVTVTRTIDNERVQNIKVLGVDLEKKRIHVATIPTKAVYDISYTAREQVFDPNTDYFVSYKYGARKKALIDNFAALLGLETGTFARTEIFDLINNQSSVVLSGIPVGYEDVLIYLTGDPDKSPMSTATAFDYSTGTLEFVPLTSADNYTIEYVVSGWQREQLRTAVLSLIQAFTTGPTERSLTDVITALAGLEPSVVEAITNGFNLTNGEDSDFLNPLEPKTSPILSDGSSSIEYAASRFANGLNLKSTNGAYVSYGALNNVHVEEGAFSFLLGTHWDGNDGVSHPFFDLMGTDEFTNRITCYKNKKGLLAFEVHDKDSRLYRATTNITRIPRNEIRYLEEGDSFTQLSYSPSYTIEDLDADGQSDIFGAEDTEFVIAPIYGGIQGFGLNIATVVQIPNNIDYTVESSFLSAATRIRTLAGCYHNHGAKLTVQTESSFMEGCSLYDNVLLDLVTNGHDVHLLIDFPSTVISDEDREVYILERRSQLNSLGIVALESDGVAGGYEMHDFASLFPELGFEFASAYINPITGETLEGRTDVFRASVESNFSIPSPEGELIYLPGDPDIDFQKNPMIVQSFIPITNSLYSAMETANPDVVNSWYFTINLEDFTTTEVTLFDGWLTTTIEPLIETQAVSWHTLTDIFLIFKEYEKFLEVNRNRVRFVTESYGGYGAYGYGGLQDIRALRWDEPTNILTFDPVDKTGFYLFSYISGFSEYEEAEHLITCSWKLHTNDGQPAMVKLYLDGELMNHRVFGDI